MRRVVIADDEPLARTRLKTMLARHQGYEIAAECRDGDETVQTLATSPPDLLFLDIKMPALDGFEVLEALAEAARPPAIVFVTAFADRAVDAFDQNAADFLLKPYDAARFDRAMQRVDDRLRAGSAADATAMRKVLESINPRPHAERFLVRGTSHLYFVRSAEVEWIDAAANYVRLHAGGRVHFVRGTVKGVEERLDSEKFIRVHRSMIVNLDFVKRLEPSEHGEYMITMQDGARIRSSRTYNARLRSVFRG
jgi:two-component system LytT family response regulator